MLHNTHIRLRKVEPQDVPFLYIVENDTVQWNETDVHNPLSQKDLHDYIESSTGDIYRDGQLRLIIENLDGTTLGVADLFDLDIRNSKAALGLYVLPEWRSKRVAFQAVELLEEYAFSFLRLHQLYAVISVRNAACMHLFEQLGYRHTATLVQWVNNSDATVWQKFDTDNTL